MTTGQRVGAYADGGDLQVVDLLDRLLEKGACLSGDVLLSVAGIDLVWVGLRAIVAAVETARPHDFADSPPSAPRGLSSRPPAAVGGPSVDASIPHAGAAPPIAPTSSPSRTVEPMSRPVEEGPAGRMDLTEDGVERGLAQLVLTIVDLLRQLLERQAITRMEAGSLDEAEVDRLGSAFARLAERMDDLKDTFGLTDEDLELRLGPIHDIV